MKIILSVLAAAGVIYFVSRRRSRGVALADEWARQTDALDRVLRIGREHDRDHEAIQNELDGMFERGEMPDGVSPELGISEIIATLQQIIADRDERDFHTKR